MRVSGIDKCECINGLGFGTTLYTQGCPFHCPECHNKKTWDYNDGEEYSQEIENLLFSMIRKPYIKHFCISGGEPLIEQNLFELAKLIAKVRQTKPDIKIWIYSGYTYEQLLSRKHKYVKYLDYILDNIDVLVDGSFIQEKKDITLAFRGSSNQRIIDMRQTNNHDIVLLDL